MYQSNYDKFPFVPVNGSLWKGWDSIGKMLRKKIKESGKERFILAVECYHGVHHQELMDGFNTLLPDQFVPTSEIFYSESEIRKLTYPERYGRSDFWIHDPAFLCGFHRSCKDEFCKEKYTEDERIGSCVRICSINRCRRSRHAGLCRYAQMGTSIAAAKTRDKQHRHTESERATGSSI